MFAKGNDGVKDQINYTLSNKPTLPYLFFKKQKLRLAFQGQFSITNEIRKCNSRTSNLPKSLDVLLASHERAF
jgi:hypothetical protein